MFGDHSAQQQQHRQKKKTSILVTSATTTATDTDTSSVSGVPVVHDSNRNKGFIIDLSTGNTTTTDQFESSFSSLNQSNHNNNNNNSHNMTQFRGNNKKSKGFFRPLVLLILGIALIMASVMMIENSRELYDVPSYSTLQKPGSAGGGSFVSNSKSKSKSSSQYTNSNFDVNAPPVAKSFWESATTTSSSTRNSHKKSPYRHYNNGATNSINTQNKKNGMDMDRNSFIFWGQQANRMEEQNDFDIKKKKAGSAFGSSPNEVAQPFPIIDENDDEPLPSAVVIPGAQQVVIPAADALMCRESVVDFVINATDLHDECLGLKNAFTKYCTDANVDDGGTGNSNGAEQTPPTTPVQPQSKRTRTRRRLSTTNTTSTKNTMKDYMARYTSTDKNQEKHENKNVISWLKHRIHRLRLELRWWWNPDVAKTMMIDEIIAEYQDHISNDEDKNRSSSKTKHNRRRRRLNMLQERPAIEAEVDPDAPELVVPAMKTSKGNSNDGDNTTEDAGGGGDSIVSTTTAEQNQTTTTTQQPAVTKKQTTSLSLPTNMHHLSDKTLGESLMLQQGDMIKASIKASQNNTNTTQDVNKEVAKATAAASSKAVSDTVDFVASVLNDPTSVEARTCCTSILNVYHENCEVDEEEELSDIRLFIVVVVIALCGMIKSLIRHFQIRWLPEAAGCILVGVAAGWGLTYYPHHDFSFDGKWFLRILVPPIVFEAALSIDKRSFNRHVVPIMMYAFVGTLLATALTAVVVHEGSRYFQGCATIPYIEALTFGSLISSIDPIAVLSVLSNMGMTDTDTIYVVIFGESLLNDGIAIVLFETLKHFLDDNMTVDGDAMLAAAIHFCVVALGSLLVGLSSGICCTVYYWMMHGCQTPLVEVLMFCCWALLPYYICDGIEWSGIVAVVAAGFVMDLNVVGEHHTDEKGDECEEPPSSGNLMNPKGGKRRSSRRQIFAKDGHLSTEARTHIGFVTEIIATLMETVIFAYLGLFLFSSRYHWNYYHTLVAIGGCCLSRAIMIPSLSALANGITKYNQVRSTAWGQQLPHQSTTEKQDKPAGVIIDKKMQLVLWFAGLRGAMSFALVENIPLYDPVTGEGTTLKSELKAMTCACIIFTVFVLGGCTYYMMDCIGMAPIGASGGAHKPSLLEKEMETIGLLSKQRSEDQDDNDDVVKTSSGWGNSSQGEVYQQEIQGPTKSQNSVFRQRINPAS